MTESMVCCPLQGTDGDEGPSAFSSSVRKARKEHRCSECREVVSVGAKYVYDSGIWDGIPGSYKTCLSCVEIRAHFACNGWVYECLWSDLEENFFPDMKAGGPCMEGLSPAAKARLFERRMKWYEEQHS